MSEACCLYGEEEKCLECWCRKINLRCRYEGKIKVCPEDIGKEVVD
jgi:hypothetical protein